MNLSKIKESLCRVSDEIRRIANLMDEDTQTSNCKDRVGNLEWKSTNKTMDWHEALDYASTTVIWRLPTKEEALNASDEIKAFPGKYWTDALARGLNCAFYIDRGQIVCGRASDTHHVRLVRYISRPEITMFY